jgi:hypothetical protein
MSRLPKFTNGLANVHLPIWNAFIVGNGFHTISVIAALEEDLGLHHREPGGSGTRYVWQVWEPKSMITARCSEKT